MAVDERMDFSTNVAIGSSQRIDPSVMVDGCVCQKLPTDFYNSSVKYYRRYVYRRIFYRRKFVGKISLPMDYGHY